MLRIDPLHIPAVRVRGDVQNAHDQCLFTAPARRRRFPKSWATPVNVETQFHEKNEPTLSSNVAMEISH